MSNTMTPIEQDKELREKLLNLRITVWKQANLNGQANLDHDSVDEILRLITADRKRVALEARLEENEEWRRFSKEAQRGILPIDFKARIIILKDPYQLSEAKQEEV